MPCWGCREKLVYPNVGEIHHIASRCHKTLCHHRTNLFWAGKVCCHPHAGGKLGVSRQLWLKRKFDPSGWNEDVMLELLRRRYGKRAEYLLRESYQWEDDSSASADAA